MSVMAGDPKRQHGPSDTAIVPAAWRALDRSFAHALEEMRHAAPLDALEPAERSLLRELLSSWLQGKEAPTQGDLASRAGLSVRSVRTHLDRLTRLGVLHATREPGRAAVFSAGPVLAAFLREFAAGRDPRTWRWGDPRTWRWVDTPARQTDRIARTPAAGTGGISSAPAAETDRIVSTPAAGGDGATHTPAAGAEVPRSSTVPLRAAITPTLQRIRAPGLSSSATDAPRAPTRVPLKEEKKLILSSSLPEKGDPARPTRPTTVDATARRRVACQAFAAHFTRANPGAPLPRSFDGSVVAMVERSVADCTGDEATLLQKQLDAIEGAFAKSTHRAPTATFIWRELEHFHRHLAHGRAMRPAPKAPPKPRKTTPDEPCADPAWLAKHLAEGIPRIDPLYAATHSTAVHTDQE